MSVSEADLCSSTAAAKRRSEWTAAVSAARPALSHRGSCGHGSAVWTSWCRRRRAGSLRCLSRPPSRPTTSAHPRECCRRSPSPCPSLATEVWCPAPPTASASSRHVLESVPWCCCVCASRIWRLERIERRLSDACGWRWVRQIGRGRGACTRAHALDSTTAPASTTSPGSDQCVSTLQSPLACSRKPQRTMSAHCLQVCSSAASCCVAGTHRLLCLSPDSDVRLRCERSHCNADHSITHDSLSILGCASQ